jgi:SH3-like domain-containing protein
MSARPALTAALALGVLSFASPLAAASSADPDYVVIVHQQVNLRTGPATDRAVIGKMEKGDLFRLASENDEWFEVELFSGGRGWVSKTMAARLRPDQIIAGHGLALPPDPTTQHSLYASVRVAQARAAREAAELVPPAVDATCHDTARRVIEDRLVLDVFHVYGVQPALFGELVDEAARRGW